MQAFIFDGSMEGLLSAVFEFFERRGKGEGLWQPAEAALYTAATWLPDAFADPVTVHSDPQKAARVWSGLEKRLDKTWLRRCYCCYLSENAADWMQLFSFCNYVFSGGRADNFGNPHVQAVAASARSVEREKHRMEAFIRFEELQDRLFYAVAEPDFNVLPLIAKHFKDRFADQNWLIYDRRRNYGLHYQSGQLAEVVMDNRPPLKTEADLHADKEGNYAQLWKDYFKSTNIASRKNMQLHIRHVPRRYWKYLTEKQPG